MAAPPWEWRQVDRGRTGPEREARGVRGGHRRAHHGYGRRAGVRPDDRKLAALGRLNALRRLYREGPSQVTDSGLCYLVTFPLEVLELGESSQITDHGLVELRLIRSLRWLEVTGCPQLTVAGLQALQAALPRCEIVA